MITKAKSSDMKQKKKQSRSSSKRNSGENPESALDSSHAPRFFSNVRSKLSSGRDLKHMFRHLRRKKASGVTPQARLVKCPKCQKTLQEPEDVPLYRCGRCDTVLQATQWMSEGKFAQISDNSVSEAVLLSGEEYDSRAEDEYADTCSGVYEAAASSSGARSYDSETTYKHERAEVPKEPLSRHKFPVTSDSDVSSSTAHRDSIQRGRYEILPRVPIPSSPSPSSAYERGSPFHASQVSASEKSYHHQHNHFREYEKGGWSGGTSRTSSIHFFDDTWHYQSRGQSPMQNSRYQEFSGQSFYDCNSSCTATPPRAAQSEHSYPAWSSEIESCSQKGSYRDIKGYVTERNRVVKRHVLPAAGGAPFVTCYYCLQLLQLSHVFLDGKRKRSQVRCGGCYGLLSFSVKEKARTVPYTPSVLDSRPSRADDRVTNHQDDQDSASVDHGECCPDEAPQSDLNSDCGDSICKSSLSNDGELVSPRTFQGVAVHEDKQSMSSECSDTMSETPQFQLVSLANDGQRFSDNPESHETSGIHLEQSHDAHSDHSRNEYENASDRHELDNTTDDNVGCDLEDSGYERSETRDGSKMITDGSHETSEIHLEQSLDAHSDHSRNEYENTNEETNKTTKESEVIEERPVSQSAAPVKENENTCETLELAESAREMRNFEWEKPEEESKNGGERTWEETMGDRPGLHLEEYESNYKDDIEGRFGKESEWNAGTERVPTFRIDDSELGKLLEPHDAVEERSEICFWLSPDDCEISREVIEFHEFRREDVFHLEPSPKVGENQTESIKAGETTKEGQWLQLEKYENESSNFTETVEPRNEVSRVCLGEQPEQEQEEEALAEMLFNSDMSGDTHENLRQTIEPGAAEEDRSACSSRLCSDDHDCSSKMINLDGETAEHTSGDHSEQLQDEDGKFGLTFEPHSHLDSTMDPSEVVGLRHALYWTQSSPLRSPLTSPLHTPVGSPRRHLMGSPLHSPMASPLHSPLATPLHSPMASPQRFHIVSPLRSPIVTPSSLTDVFFFSNNS